MPTATPSPWETIDAAIKKLYDIFPQRRPG